MSADEKVSNIGIEPCQDTELLSRLFLELGEDERSDIKRTQQQAFEDMEAFLERGEKAFKFTSDGKTAGYALVDGSREPFYLHHFYICRAERRKGAGTAAFNLLIETLGVREMDLEVYVWNERGRAFWNSLGFKPRAIKMRLGQ